MQNQKKQLSERFKKSIYCNKYSVTDNRVAEISDAHAQKHIREWLDSSSRGVKRLFVFTYNNATGEDRVFANSYKKHLLPRIKIENYHVEIDGRNFIQSVN